MRLENGWTAKRYSVYRMLLGTYLAVHFAQLIPWATEVFSNQGMLSSAAHSPLYPLFPNILFFADSPRAVTTLLAIGIALSISLVVGFRDRYAAIGIWYVWACLFSRNPLISNPSLPFVGWILLAHACLPRAPEGSLDARQKGTRDVRWAFPPELFAVAWIVMAIAYSYSGIAKLTSPSWVDGSALSHVLSNPLARATWLREFLLTLPDVVLRLGAWGGLLLEIAFAPLALFRVARPVLWVSMVGMHLSLFALVDFPDLSLGMLLLHGFTFDFDWIRNAR